MLLFSKLYKLCFGYFDPENIFCIMKTNNFQGDFTNISARKEALAITRTLLVPPTGPSYRDTPVLIKHHNTNILNIGKIIRSWTSVF